MHPASPQPPLTSPPSPTKHTRVYGFILAALVVIFDQITKLYINGHLIYGERIQILPIFDLTLVYNRGAAFSFLSTAAGWQRWFFILLGLGVTLVLARLVYRKALSHPRFALALVLIMGGTLGNVVDRIAYGHVIDFLLFYWHHYYYPAFNLADISITCGAILLCFSPLPLFKPDHA